MKPTVNLLKSIFSNYVIPEDNEITGKSPTVNNLENSLSNSLKDLICITGLDGKIQYVSTNFCKQLGYPKIFIISHYYTQFIHPDDIQKTAEELKFLTIEKHKPHTFKNRYLKSNGEVLHIEWKVIYDEKKKCFFATSKDILKASIVNIVNQNQSEEIKPVNELFKIGLWSYNLLTSELTWSKEMFNIYEVNQPDASIHKIEIPKNNILNEDTCNWQIINTNKKYKEATDETEHVLPSGRVKWIQKTTENIFTNDDKLIQINGVCIDITEVKRCHEKVIKTIEEKDILLKELHHRVKNNMQVISSMLNLHSNRIGDESLKSIFSESQQRIKSMASVHDLLLQSPDFKTIDFKSYLENLTNDIINSFKAPGQEIALFLKTDEIKFSLDKAIPLGLLINELVTNSIKHGFKNRKNGKIYVQLNSGLNFKYELLYKDDGNGFQTESKIKEDSLGMMLVENLTDQLDGELYRKTSAKRTCYKLLF